MRQDFDYILLPGINGSDKSHWQTRSHRTSIPSRGDHLRRPAPEHASSPIADCGQRRRPLRQCRRHPRHVESWVSGLVILRGQLREPPRRVDGRPGPSHPVHCGPATSTQQTT